MWGRWGSYVITPIFLEQLREAPDINVWVFDIEVTFVFVLVEGRNAFPFAIDKEWTSSEGSYRKS